MTAFADRLAAHIARHRAVLNRLETHLGCVACAGPLTDGVCPRCDPPDEEQAG